jgi:N-acetylglucosaminyl-diphospho-decaprenol L-rhamnosyltransferase
MPQEPAVVEDPIGPRVSAILVSFNQAEALRRALEALEHSQERERLEILVVDCGSRDDSARIDAEFPAISMLRLPHHLGATRAMNIGLRTAKAELIFFLSPDVEVLPDTLVRLAERLEAETDAAAACPLLVNEAGAPVSRVFAIPTREALASRELQERKLPDLGEESVPVDYPSLDALLVRRQFLRSMNFFDERFGQYWADADLAMKIRQGGKKIRLHPAIRAKLHPGEDPLEGDSLAAADKTLGAAAFLGKYQGFSAGLSFRLAAIFKALASFDFKRLSMLISGQKLDGSQAG